MLIHMTFTMEITKVESSCLRECKGGVMEIKEIRQKTGMSQSEFSKHFEIPIRTIQCWEIGQRNPPDYIPKLLERLWNLETADQ